MPTPVTSPSPYCAAASLLRYCDWQLVADWAADPTGPASPRPTRQAVLDPTSPAGAVVAAGLLAASGELESYCLRGGHYSPADLAALTGAGKAYLERLVAGLTLWGLACRRNPASADPEKVPGAKAALDALEALRTGSRIFGLAAQIDAGAGMEATPLVDVSGPGRTVNKAGRYFGNRGC